jgi:uncharacterized membrane protein
MTARELRHELGAWRARRRARRQEQRRQARKQQLVLWGGPVEAGRVLAFSDAIFAIAITLLTINLEVRPGLHGTAFTTALHQLLPAFGAYALSFLILGQLWLAHHRIFGVIARVDYVVLRRNLLFLGLIAIMPFPVRLLSDYHERPMAVAIYAVAFIAAMALQLVVWLDVTRPERRDLLTEPVPDEVRTGFSRTLAGMLLVFGAVMPLAMLAPQYAAVIWTAMIPLRLVVGRFTRRGRAGRGGVAGACWGWAPCTHLARWPGVFGPPWSWLARRAGATSSGPMQLPGSVGRGPWLGR